MHLTVLVLGRDVDRQLAPFGPRTRLTAYRQHVDPAELEHARQVFRREPSFGVDPDDLPAVVRWFADEHLYSAVGPGVDRDQDGWFFWSTRNWLVRWDYWLFGWRFEDLLVTRPGGAMVRRDAYFYSGPHADRPDDWLRAPEGVVLYGAQSYLGDIDLTDRTADAVVRDGCWREPAVVAELTRGLPDSTLVTMVDCHR